MATITITIEDNKLDNVALDLAEVFPREDGDTDVKFVKAVILQQLRQARRQGKHKRVAKATTVQDGDIG